MAETERVRTRYLGSFDLSLLREGDTVRSASDGSGACYVEQPTESGTVYGLRIELGQMVERLPSSGLLIAYSDDAGTGR